MKKSQKKLRLSRETLVSLQDQGLRRVAGGETNEIETSCEGTARCSEFGGCGGGSGTCAGCNTNGCPSDTYEIVTSCQSGSMFC